MPRISELPPLAELSPAVQIPVYHDNGLPATERAAAQLFFDKVWPVGSIFLSAVDTDPAELLGFGTWQVFGAGRVLVGLDVTQAEFDAVEKTGGAKTHTLTVAEMPAHTHTQDAHTHTQQPHGHGKTASNTAATSGANVTRGTGAQATVTVDNTTAVNNSTTAVNQNTGGGAAHNNLPPFITVRMWRRVA